MNFVYFIIKEKKILKSIIITEITVAAVAKNTTTITTTPIRKNTTITIAKKNITKEKESKKFI